MVIPERHTDENVTRFRGSTRDVARMLKSWGRSAEIAICGWNISRLQN